MRTLLLITLFGLVCFSAQAQYSKYQGYMGNKFAIKANATAGLSFPGGNIVKILPGFGGELEYVSKKHLSFMFDFEMQRAGFKIDENRLDAYQNYIPNQDYKYKTNNYIFMLAIRKYLKKRGSFAPYGTYITYRAGFMFSNFEDYVAESDFILPRKESINKPIVGLQFGRQFIFAKRGIIDAGISTSYVFALLTSNSGQTIGGAQVPSENLMFSQLFRAYISIGFLAF